ncbi:hypothetical protein B0J11DRAFT_519531 [Dendryphion nanum]|uniref:Uncharacterized protein n=1 Tax=Dendryphion nanum TaxID=256645 RepID=A0A9P9IW81_9PLEO|nr:hypothetical protein B0J11DRAFT_519531 [Dendryphion nanum]
MASPPTAMSHSAPVRVTESPVDLHHPVPDLQSLQGAYVGNIERLEDHAERMSEKGSDLGEEIRKLHNEQKLSDSRRSSLRSVPPVDEVARPFTTRSRNASTSSYTNSIVDVNGAARWGGYSPAGFITSPVGSLHSTSTPLQRQRSGSRASRLGQVVHAEKHTEQDSPGSPQSHKSVPRSLPRDNSPPPPSHRSVSSFTRQYDQIAQELQDEIHLTSGHTPELDGTHRENYEDHHYDHRDMPDRPPTAASTDTTHQARTLWQDFDGVHCPDTVPEEEPTPSQGSGSRKSSLMKPSVQLSEQGVPPPSDDMVFYPAPVPKMLNLPKRLSQMPPATVQARRRTQLLESMQADNRKSAPWLVEQSAESKPNRKSMDPRKSRQSLANLPPQLRASAYFDQAPPAQQFEVKGDSAEDTLDNILEASAHAPVSAFTDHPFAGRVGNEVYGKEKHTRKTSQIDILDKAETRKSRASMNILDTHRNSSGDPLNKLKKRNSSADLNMLTVRASESRMSLGDELDDPDQQARGPADLDDRTPTRLSYERDPERLDEERPEHDEEEEAEAEEEEESQYFGPPTTLLAELQMRKQQQKSRNLTAATAFPNGMHSTLLELDAVAEIEKKKRRNQKVNLAWEAAPPVAPENDDSEDDVPLGLLFPGREGLANKRAGNLQPASDWDRPLGLIAQRELEDNEPLSRRRNRLVGTDPSRRRTQFLEMQPEQQHLEHHTGNTAHSESEEEVEGETLADRIRRLKERQALDNALGADVRKSTVSGDFAAEMMSQFGVAEADETKPKPTPSPGVDEEETLGQRRARLQSEAMAQGDSNRTSTQPPLRSSMSMADILRAHPIDHTNSARKVSDEQLMSSLPQGSLLHQDALKKSRHEASRMSMNKRMSSFGALDQPLLGNVGKPAPELAISAKIQAYKDRMAGTTAAQGAQTQYNQTMMFTPVGGMTPTTSNVHLSGQRENFFPQANMGMVNSMGMNGMGMNPHGFVYQGNAMQQQQQMMPMNMGMMGMQNGMPMTYPYTPMGGMPMNAMQMQQQTMMMEPPMDPRQRDVIDRWRSGVN